MDNNNIDVKPQFNMAPETTKEERNTPEYLAQLLKDKKQIQAFPNVFIHLERLLDEGKKICYLTFQLCLYFLLSYLK